jgi:hypothetical protein
MQRVDIKYTAFSRDTIQVDNNCSTDNGESGFDRYMDTAVLVTYFIMFRQKLSAGN